jgi:hypothetical protein
MGWREGLGSVGKMNVSVGRGRAEGARFGGVGKRAWRPPFSSKTPMGVELGPPVVADGDSPPCHLVRHVGKGFVWGKLGVDTIFFRIPGWVDKDCSDDRLASAT